MHRYRSTLRTLIGAGLLALAPLVAAWPQTIDVQVRVDLLEDRGPRGQASVRGVEAKPQNPLNRGNILVWLSPEPGVTMTSLAPAGSPGRFRMEQKNKNFNPHIMVVPLGSTVEFPNLDPFFHNVFSQFNGKRFDLGLYEAGSTREVHFDHEGISYLFCNIHSQMAAVIVTLRTPYYALGSRSGSLELHDVPPGDYEMHVWAEGADPKSLQDLSRRVRISPSQRDLGAMQVYVTGSLAQHKNKFGEDYRPEPDQSY